MDLKKKNLLVPGKKSLISPIGSPVKIDKNKKAQD